MSKLEVFTAAGALKQTATSMEAEDVHIDDAGGLFTAIDVEDALAELATDAAGSGTTLGGGAFRNSIRNGSQTWLYSDFYGHPSQIANVTGNMGEGFMARTSNTGSNINASADPLIIAEHPGIIELDTGTNAGGGVSVAGGSPGISLSLMPTVVLGTGVTRFGTWVRFEDLSDAGNTFFIYAGLMDSVDARAQSNGIYFRYSHGLSAGNWEFGGEVATVETFSDSGVAAAADTWYKLEVEVAADGETATFYINGVSVGTKTAAEIPEGTGAPVMPNVAIWKSVGTTRRRLNIDAIFFMQAINR